MHANKISLRVPVSVKNVILKNGTVVNRIFEEIFTDHPEIEEELIDTLSQQRHSRVKSVDSQKVALSFCLKTSDREDDDNYQPVCSVTIHAVFSLGSKPERVGLVLETESVVTMVGIYPSSPFVGGKPSWIDVEIPYNGGDVAPDNLLSYIVAEVGETLLRKAEPVV